MPVQRVVGGIQIKRDLRRRRRIRIQEQIDEQGLDRGRIGGDTGVAAGFGATAFQPVQRALARQRRAAGPPGGKLARQHRQHRVVAEFVVIDQVLIAQRNANHPLGHQRLHTVFHERRVARVLEAGGKAAGHTDHPVGRAQQQRAGVRGDPPALPGVEIQTAPGYSLSASAISYVAARFCCRRTLSADAGCVSRICGNARGVLAWLPA